VTGRPRRSWHPAGTDRDDAEQLAARLAAERNGRDDDVRTLTFGAYVMAQWLPGKKLMLATSTYRGYLRKTQLHVLPALGRVKLGRLRAHHLEPLYDQVLNPTDRWPGLAPKTVYDVHLVIRARSPTLSGRGAGHSGV